ncbi:MAG: prenyltransferase/squalene oxidase repeat-containing protein [Thermoplasmata archaeon]
MRVAPRLRRWLTEPDADPSVRYRYWTEVEGRSPGDPKAKSARAAIGTKGWAAQLLEHQFPDGHFVTDGTDSEDLYLPKYIASNWRMIVLADLGLTRTDPRIAKLAELVLDRWGEELSDPSAELCVRGNAARSLIRFGYRDHPVVRKALRGLVESQKADGGWHCFRSRTGTLDGWEGLAALAEIPESERDGDVRRALERGAEFYLGRRLMREGRARYAPWFRIHYPNHYYYDLLVGLRILTRLGYGGDRRLRPALRWLIDRRAPTGSWALDRSHPDLDPVGAGYSMDRVVYPMQLEPLERPSRWATVEALSVLARVEADGGKVG